MSRPKVMKCGFCSYPLTGCRCKQSRRNISKVMGFKHNEKVPPNCLRKDCFTEMLIDAAEATLAEEGYV